MLLKAKKSLIINNNIFILNNKVVITIFILNLNK